MPTSNCADTLPMECVSYLKQLLTAPNPGPLPPHLAEIREMEEVAHYIATLREILGQFSRGDLSQDVRLRGVLAGSLKGLQANLRHLTWQMDQIAHGDLSQRTDFLTGFSESFNHMVEQLATNRDELIENEKTLLSLTRQLQYEIQQREIALKALKESENKFKFLARHDPLTNVLNRRSFFELAEREISYGWTQDHDCGVAMIDIDNFKHFNDTYGHQFGDVALKHVVACGQSTLRQGDLLGRYGGEEFIFLFAAVNQDQAMQAAERVRAIIADTPLELGDIKIGMRVSVGVSLVERQNPEEKKTIDQLLRETISRADAALYKSKKAGKNRVSLWTEDLGFQQGES